jgi:hypothetical protein
MTKISIALALALAGCGGDTFGGGSTTEALCKRADECNALNGSVQECVEAFDRCTGEMTPSERADWEHAVEECLEYDSCGLAVDCYFNDVPPWCQ